MSDFRLKVFQSVAKNLSFTKASQELFVSQPAITKHIQELEACYQARLFDRQGNKISLTEAGKLLLEHSERILDAYKRLEYEMHLLHGDYIGELKLGASTTIAQYVLPPLLGNFIRKFPQVDLSLLNGNSREIETALQEHRIDLGLVEGIFRLPNLKYTTFLDDELVAIVHAQSKLSLPDEITPEDLQHIPLVLRERGSGTLDVFERALLQHSIKLSSLNVLMYLGGTESIKLFLEKRWAIWYNVKNQQGGLRYEESGILYPAGDIHRCISLCGLSDRQLYAGKAQERRGAEGCRQIRLHPGPEQR